MWGPLLDTHDSLTVDQRGTGCSGAVDCPSVQQTVYLTPDNVSACAQRLGNTSDLYGIELAAADIAAVLDHLNLTQPIDLYGER